MKLNKEKIGYYRRLCELGFSKSDSAFYTSKLFSKDNPLIQQYYLFEDNLNKYVNNKISIETFRINAEDLFLD